MKPKMRRNLPGTFLTQNLGEGAWRLSRSEAAPIDVFLRGAESGAADALRSPSVRDIGIEWQAETVVLTMTSAEQPRIITAQSAIVHEPLPRLYEALPLVSLDEKARRFNAACFASFAFPAAATCSALLARRKRDRH